MDSMCSQIIQSLKSKGIFDQFRKDCIADVDTKPAYINLHARVNKSVNDYLQHIPWSSNMNKIKARDGMRKQIVDSSYFNKGVDRIVNQTVDPKINTAFLPMVEDFVYDHLGLQKPKPGENMKDDDKTCMNEEMDIDPYDEDRNEQDQEPNFSENANDDENSRKRKLGEEYYSYQDQYSNHQYDEREYENSEDGDFHRPKRLKPGFIDSFREVKEDVKPPSPLLPPSPSPSIEVPSIEVEEEEKDEPAQDSYVKEEDEEEAEEKGDKSDLLLENVESSDELCIEDNTTDTFNNNSNFNNEDEVNDIELQEQEQLQVLATPANGYDSFNSNYYSSTTNNNNILNSTENSEDLLYPPGEEKDLIIVEDESSKQGEEEEDEISSQVVEEEEEEEKEKVNAEEEQEKVNAEEEQEKVNAEEEQEKVNAEEEQEKVNVEEEQEKVSVEEEQEKVHVEDDDEESPAFEAISSPLHLFSTSVLNSLTPPKPTRDENVDESQRTDFTNYFSKHQPLDTTQTDSFIHNDSPFQIPPPPLFDENSHAISVENDESGIHTNEKNQSSSSLNKQRDSSNNAKEDSSSHKKSSSSSSSSDKHKSSRSHSSSKSSSSYRSSDRHSRRRSRGDEDHSDKRSSSSSHNKHRDSGGSSRRESSSSSKHSSSRYSSSHHSESSSSRKNSSSTSDKRSQDKEKDNKDSKIRKHSSDRSHQKSSEDKSSSKYSQYSSSSSTKVSDKSSHRTEASSSSSKRSHSSTSSSSKKDESRHKSSASSSKSSSSRSNEKNRDYHKDSGNSSESKSSKSKSSGDEKDKADNYDTSTTNKNINNNNNNNNYYHYNDQKENTDDIHLANDINHYSNNNKDQNKDNVQNYNKHDTTDTNYPISNTNTIYDSTENNNKVYEVTDMDVLDIPLPKEVEPEEKTEHYNSSSKQQITYQTSCTKTRNHKEQDAEEEQVKDLESNEEDESMTIDVTIPNIEEQEHTNQIHQEIEIDDEKVSVQNVQDNNLGTTTTSEEYTLINMCSISFETEKSKNNDNSINKDEEKIQQEQETVYLEKTDSSSDDEVEELEVEEEEEEEEINVEKNNIIEDDEDRDLCIDTNSLPSVSAHNNEHDDDEDDDDDGNATTDDDAEDDDVQIIDNEIEENMTAIPNSTQKIIPSNIDTSNVQSNYNYDTDKIVQEKNRKIRQYEEVEEEEEDGFKGFSDHERLTPEKRAYLSQFEDPLFDEGKVPLSEDEKMKIQSAFFLEYSKIVSIKFDDYKINEKMKDWLRSHRADVRYNNNDTGTSKKNKNNFSNKTCDVTNRL